METVTRNVGELDVPDRMALERVIGHPLQASEQIIIQIAALPHAPTTAPITASSPLPDWCNIYEGLNEEQIDELDRCIIRSNSNRLLD